MYISLGIYIYLALFYYSINPNNITLREFGGAHGLFLIGFFIIFSIFWSLYETFRFIYKKSKRSFIFLLCVVLLFVFLFKYKLSISCNNWELGIQEEIDFGD